MAFPTTPISTTHLDQGTDSPATARADILALAQAVNEIISARGGPLGIASLGADGVVPAVELSGPNILAALIGVAGADSGLDADLLDGLQGAAYALVDGSRTCTPTGANGQTFSRDTAATASVATAVTLRQTTSGTPAAGFGVGLGFRLNSTGSTGALAAEINAAWTDATIGSLDSLVSIRAIEAGSVADQAIFDAGHIELRQLSSVSGDAPAGRAWIYAKAGGLYVKMPSTAELLLGGGGSGVSDHGALTGLTDDDHTQYLLASGARALTGELDHGAYSAVFSQLGSDPSSPSAGVWRLYFKSGGLYYRNSAGTVTGPLGTSSGVTAHADLTGLTTGDPHTQYLLRQPAADVVINDAGGDFNFRVEGDTVANLFSLDAGLDRIFVNDSPSAHAPEARFNIVAGANNHGLFVSSETMGFAGLYAATSNGFAIHAVTSGASARGLYVASAVTSRTNYLAMIEDLAGDNTGDVLRVAIPFTKTGTIISARVGSQAMFRVNHDMTLINGSQLATHDFRVDGAGVTHLLFADVSENCVGIAGAPSGIARLEAYSAGGADGIYCHGTSATGLRINMTSGSGVDATVTSGTAIVGSASDKTGACATFYRATTGASAMPLVNIFQAGADDGTMLLVETAGTGKLFQFGVTGAAILSLQNGGELLWKQRGSDPATPAAGYWCLYFKSGGLYMKDSAGTVKLVTAV